MQTQISEKLRKRANRIKKWLKDDNIASAFQSYHYRQGKDVGILNRLLDKSEIDKINSITKDDIKIIQQQPYQFKMVTEKSSPESRLSVLRAKKLGGIFDKELYEATLQEVINSKTDRERNLWLFLEENYDCEVCELEYSGQNMFDINIRTPMGKFLEWGITRQNIIKFLNDQKVELLILDDEKYSILLKLIEKGEKDDSLMITGSGFDETDFSFGSDNWNNIRSCFSYYLNNKIPFSLVVREFTKIKTDNIPYKKIAGLFVGNEEIVCLDANAMEDAHTIDNQTGKKIPREKYVSFVTVDKIV